MRLQGELPFALVLILTNSYQKAIHPPSCPAAPTTIAHPQLAIRRRTAHPRTVPFHPSRRSTGRLARSRRLQVANCERLGGNAERPGGVKSQLWIEEMESTGSEITQT